MIPCHKIFLIPNPSHLLQTSSKLLDYLSSLKKNLDLI